MALGRGARRRVGARQLGCRGQPSRDVPDVERVDEQARTLGHELRRAAHPRRDDGAPAGHGLEHGLAEGLDEARLADDPRRRHVLAYLVIRHRADEPDTTPALERRPQWPIADDRERCIGVLEPAESLCEPHDVLAFDQRADEEVGRRATRRGRNRERVQIDAAIHDLGLAAGLRHGPLELPAQVARNGDNGGGALADPAGRPADGGVRACVRHVLPVGGDDQRRARRYGRNQACGHQEVRVDDIWTEPARSRSRSPGQVDVTALPSGTAVDHRQLDLVTAVEERPLQSLHEDAEVRVLGTRVHLRDEEDPQTAATLVARDLHDAEAHLVRRPLAPEHVAWRRRDPVPAVMPPHRIEAARHS